MHDRKVILRLSSTSKPLWYAYTICRFLSVTSSRFIILWPCLPTSYPFLLCHPQGWERRRYFLLLVDTCYIVNATPEDPLLLRRRSDTDRVEQLLHLLNDTDVLQLTSSVREGDEERLVVRPSISEIFANRGIVELIATFEYDDDDDDDDDDDGNYWTTISFLSNQTVNE